MATTRSLVGPTPFLHPYNKNNNNAAALIKSLHLSSASSPTSVSVTMSASDHQQPPP
ncbi:hypothetical protein A2U01_0097976, partial [Trifolium medium]|nr:hypothetical protein [Trifolium medium]